LGLFHRARHDLPVAWGPSLNYSPSHENLSVIHKAFELLRAWTDGGVACIISSKCLDRRRRADLRLASCPLCAKSHRRSFVYRTATIFPLIFYGRHERAIQFGLESFIVVGRGLHKTRSETFADIHRWRQPLASSLVDNLIPSLLINADFIAHISVPRV
jgi:hypothetical protein